MEKTENCFLILERGAFPLVDKGRVATYATRELAITNKIQNEVVVEAKITWEMK